MKIKAMTYNICSGRDFASAPIKEHKYCKIDLSAAGSVIAEYAPDICALQEVRGAGAQPDFTAQAEELGRLTGMHFCFAPAIKIHGTEPYGNGLLSKYPILRCERIMIPDPELKNEKAYYETRALLVAELDVPGGLTVISTHFGLAKGEKRNAVAQVLKTVESIRTPLILMGDFNSKPDDSIIAPLFEQLTDTAGGAATPLTFPSFSPSEKIDYIFTSYDIKTLSLTAPPATASDHSPLLAELEL